MTEAERLTKLSGDIAILSKSLSKCCSLLAQTHPAAKRSLREQAKELRRISHDWLCDHYRGLVAQEERSGLSTKVQGLQEAGADSLRADTSPRTAWN
jgi:hypothetical protein